jgi:ectoine hydroxylase-related dioxygenase (phytanoyl-CoA dioxygenase family)
VGHGWDFRLEGKSLVGSALVYNKALIHAAFFRTTEAEKAGHMAGISRRREFRG